MQTRWLLVLNASLLATVALPATSFAQSSLPSCATLATNPLYGLAGNADISQTASDNQGLVSPSASVVAATSKNSAYCLVHFQYSARPANPTTGAVVQHIGINVALPLNTTDGGVPSNPTGYTYPAVNGGWNGKVENIGSGGLAGTLGSLTAATNAGYAGSTTDGGHNSSTTGTGSFGVTALNVLDTGQITDFAVESLHQEYVGALAVATSYYGQKPARNYWNGCSTGGRQGFELAIKYGQDFDGFLNGSPVIYYDQFHFAKSWPGLVNRDILQAGGSSAITSAQYSNVTKQAIAACDVLGTDTVTDGVVDDPRQCLYDPAKDPNVLDSPSGGTCTGSLCLSTVQAQAIDTMWRGPRNSFGKKMYYGWMPVISSPSQYGVGVAGGAISLTMDYQWDHANMSANAQQVYATRALAASNPLGFPNPTSYEDELELNQSPGMPGTLFSQNYQGLLDNVMNGPKHGKILAWSGSYDALVFMQGEVHWYREVATLVGAGKTDYPNTQSWYRYYHAGGVGHCGGGAGADPLVPLAADGQPQMWTDLINWVENGVVPQSAGDSTHEGILAQGGAGTVVGQRPICPYPTTAIYNGSGSTTVATNFHCGGNLDTLQTLCTTPTTVFDQANANGVDNVSLGMPPCPNTY